MKEEGQRILLSTVKTYISYGDLPVQNILVMEWSNTIVLSQPEFHLERANSATRSMTILDTK